jgi:hypothetical protein
MGPADVADRVRDRRGDFRVGAAVAWEECHASKEYPFSSYCDIDEDHAFTLLGSAPSIEFNFIDDRLSAVTLRLYTREKRFLSHDEGEKLFSELRTLLSIDYGPPYFEYKPERGDGGTSDLRSVQWKSEPSYGRREQPPTRGFELELQAMLFTSPTLPGGRADVTLEYAEEGRSDHFNRRARGGAPDSEVKKLRGVSPPSGHKRQRQ